MQEPPHRNDDLVQEILDSVCSIVGATETAHVLIRARDMLQGQHVTRDNAVDLLARIVRDAGIECEVIGTTNRVLIVQGTVHSFLSETSPKPAVRHAQAHADHEEAHTFGHLWPFLRSLLSAEKTDIWVVVGYSILSSLLALVVPVAAQAIVNAVALGVFTKQLVVLCSLVFLGLLASGILAAMERWVIDLIQRRIFVTTSFDILQRLPSIRLAALREQYAPELVNRFFDVITIQKSLGKFLLEGINAVLILLVGLIVLGVYHPFFLLYDVVLIAFLPLLVYGLGRGGIATAIYVSKRKYETASWLQEIARAQLAFKLTGARTFAHDRMDRIATAYVQDRRKHFLVLSRQIVGSMFFKSVATVGVLGLGGMLVIDQQMSLGQLVAAEIVIIMILNAVEKLIGQLDMYYELMAAIDKVASIGAKAIEDVGGTVVPQNPTGGKLHIADVWFTYEHSPQAILCGASLEIPSGSRSSLVGASGSGKSTLLHCILGLEQPQRGVITVNGVDVRSADLASLRARIGFVSQLDQLVDGTIEENITLGRRVGVDDLAWAMRLTCLHDDVNALQDGLRTHLRADGLTISYGMQRRILFARMILHRPEILLLDEAFDGIEEATKQRMVSEIFAHQGWTILNVAHDADVVKRTDAIFLMRNGKISPAAGGAHV